MSSHFIQSTSTRDTFGTEYLKIAKRGNFVYRHKKANPGEAHKREHQEYIKYIKHIENTAYANLDTWNFREKSRFCYVADPGAATDVQSECRDIY